MINTKSMTELETHVKAQEYLKAIAYAEAMSERDWINMPSLSDIAIFMVVAIVVSESFAAPGGSLLMTLMGCLKSATR